ncbi:hypothetical protein OKA04_19585 [Luteolibacter flavescens]|uniref:Uncharacterized protein n=1 Tax=Luteolibacter flavescens TaxID=1859460 RepID=A0ABT3FTN6_9BACT|nr:hypothetical protein [Luteolibacter flavescens]MCW1886951.1 hypothetical protein [Luteolibacter flavescens]
MNYSRTLQDLSPSRGDRPVAAPHRLRRWLAACVMLLGSLAPAQDEKVVLLPVEREKPVPLFFSAQTDTVIKAGIDRIEETITAKLRVHQGRPEILSIGLTGTGEITGVAGPGLKTWTVRREADGARFLDLKPELPADPKAETPKEFDVTITSLHEDTEQPVDLLLPAPGASVGFASTISLSGDGATSPRVLLVEGLQSLLGDAETQRFSGSVAARLNVKVDLKGAAPRAVELANATLDGQVTADASSVSFSLKGEVRIAKAGEAMTLLEGVALSGVTSGEGWFIRLKKDGENYIHELVGEREGSFPIDLSFEAPLVRQGDWRGVDFKVHGGAVVPVRIAGLDEGVSFKPDEAVVPERREGTWTGYLPATGRAGLAWKTGRDEGDGALFFSSSEIAETRVGAGLARRYSRLGFRVLQGKLDALKIRIDGAGEILAVRGGLVLAWSVAEEDGARMLDVRLSRPIEGEGEIEIEAQAALGVFPAKLTPPRFSPLGALRHNGYLRVSNDGAVRLEVAAKKGLMQLSPAQFPWAKQDEDLRQSFVYRFPSADYDYEVSADQVLPEVGVTEVTVHELAETDRRITTELELDVREAPLREWSVAVPADFAVASVEGAPVADYSVASDAVDGVRELKILFSQAVIGRQLITVKLEKNLAAAAGDWVLPVIGHPGAKSSRGYVGVVVTAGYRAVPGAVRGLVETPVDYFPKKMTGLQQAFRIREVEWAATMKIEALGQSVQADVFHLYSLKEGAVTGSVLVNYFVVGAPVSQWRIHVPESLGNVDVIGQNVGRDWRREGDTLVIPLARPLLGSGTVLVTFDQPMSARGGDLSPGEVRPLDVQSERGHIQVVSPLQVKYDISRSEGSVLKLDATELPAEYRLLSSAPTLAAWQYTAGDVAIGMKINWYDPGETEDQVVDYAKLASHVSRDGQVVTDARFFVKTRGRTVLELSLPQGELWESKVGGQPVNARRDGEKILVPLPANADPNEPVEVVLRYGAKGDSARSPKLAAPVLHAPTVIGEWKVTADDGRQLVPRGGLRPVRPVLAETGLEWVVSRARMGALSILLVALVGWFLQRLPGLRIPGVILILFAGVASCWLGWKAMHDRRVNIAALEYSAPVVPSDKQVLLELGNVPTWQAMLSVPGVLLVVAGIAVAIYGLWTRKHAALTVTGGLVLVGLGVLAQRFGAVVFFGGLGAILLLGKGLPGIAGLFRKRAVPVAATVALMFFAGSDFGQAAELQPAESMIQSWRIQDGRLTGEIDVEARGKADERVLLLTSPTVLTGFTGDGWRVVKAAHGEEEAYFLVASAEGKKTGRATFEMPLPAPQGGWRLPTGPAAVQRVKVSWNQPGWEFVSQRAAKVTPMAIEGGSGAELVLAPADEIVLQARPLRRDATSEETRFFVETNDLYLPGPGVVSGRHRVAVRPSRGVVKELTVLIPAGFTVGDVTDGPVGSWRFNPETHELKVGIEPAQDQAFAFSIGTQRGTATLPVDLTLEPVKVQGSAGAVGLLGLGFGDEAQSEAVNAKGMSAVNLDDFGVQLLPHDREGRALAVMHRAYRHTGGDASLALKVTPVAPELRADMKQTLSLGDDRMVLAVDLMASITRAGLFKLEVEIPAGFEVESVTGAALAHWAESTVEGVRLLNLHLNGRTLGEQAFAISLAAPFPGAQSSWPVPRVSLRGATRQTGMLTVVPERGLQVRAVSRTNVSQLDPRDAGVPRPGALAFKLLQSDWSLALAVAKLDAWVTAQVLHEVTLREGQTLSRVRLAYRIDNAAMKVLRVRVPGLDEKATATVRASGPAVGDFVPVEGEPGLWEIRFQRGVAGETAVDIEFQQTAGDSASVAPVVPVEVRQSSYFVALRTGGRLEMESPALPGGWQRSDWGVVPQSLRDAFSPQTPAAVFRAAEVEAPLAVTLKRHELEKTQDLRVERGNLTTLVSPEGASLTAVDLEVRVAEKGTLKLDLPQGADLYNVLVNEDGVPLVKDGSAWLFHVHPAPEGNRPASVRFVYAVNGKGTVLEGPKLDVPLENLTWRVMLPEGWKLAKHQGDFELQDQSRRVVKEDYRSFVSRQRAAGKQEAVALLDQANLWMRAGEQDKAGQALSKAARNGLLDQASNEDARVQLHNLKTQQATLALNTRRQRLYLDNRAEVATANGQLEQAAQENPLLQGSLNYDPQQFDRLLEGNTIDENAAMKAIANRIVTQQLAADPAPAALDVTMAERGTVLAFKRSVQVDGSEAMKLELVIEPMQSRGWAFGIILCVLTAGVLTTFYRIRKA